MPDRDDLINGDWQSWRRYVLKALEDILEEQRSQAQRVDALRIELAVLKVKAGFWGSVAGIATAAMVLAGDYLLKK